MDLLAILNYETLVDLIKLLNDKTSHELIEWELADNINTVNDFNIIYFQNKINYVKTYIEEIGTISITVTFYDGEFYTFTFCYNKYKILLNINSCDQNVMVLFKHVRFLYECAVNFIVSKHNIEFNNYTFKKLCELRKKFND